MESNKVVSLEKEVLLLIVSAGYWNEELKRKLLDVNNKNIISEMQKKKESSSNGLKSLKLELRPYFNHVVHKYKKEKCTCPQEFNLPEHKISRILELLWEANKNLICVDIMVFKLISAVKTLKINAAKSIDPDLELDEHVPSAIIERLEKLVSDDQAKDKSQNVNALLENSPLIFNIDSPAGDTSLGFTPVVSRNLLKMKKTSVKVDVESVAELIMPAKVGVSPVQPGTSRRIVSNRWEKPKSGETIMSLVERLNTMETPNKYASITTGLHSNAGTSFSKFEKSTPASKIQMPVLSQTTGRRQSLGFVKPSNCLFRRQLNPITPAPRTQTSTSFSEKPKSASDKVDQDKLIDMLVQQMVADKNSESFWSDSNVDEMDCSLSGVERIASPSTGSELKTEENKTDELMQPVPQLDPFFPTLEESILSQIIEDENELSVLVQSIVNDECTTEEPEDKSEFDMFLNEEDISKVLDSQQNLQTQEVATKCGNSSLDLLIQRFNAIKKAQPK